MTVSWSWSFAPLHSQTSSESLYWIVSVQPSLCSDSRLVQVAEQCTGLKLEQCSHQLLAAWPESCLQSISPHLGPSALLTTTTTTTTRFCLEIKGFFLISKRLMVLNNWEHGLDKTAIRGYDHNQPPPAPAAPTLRSSSFVSAEYNAIQVLLKLFLSLHFCQISHWSDALCFPRPPKAQLTEINDTKLGCTSWRGVCVLSLWLDFPPSTSPAVCEQ